MGFNDVAEFMCLNTGARGGFLSIRLPIVGQSKNGKGIWPVEPPAAIQIEHCRMYLDVLCYYYFTTIDIR
jgi:hypothetical protein